MTEEVEFFHLGYRASAPTMLLAPLPGGRTFQPFADFRAESAPPSVVSFEVGSGSREFDLVGCTFTPLVFGSQAFRNVVETEGLSGTNFYEISIAPKNEKPSPIYYGLRISGRCGPIDDSRRSRVSKIHPVLKHRFDIFLGLFFDESTWDGSDFFVSSDGSGLLFVTRRVVKACKKARLKGLYVKPLRDFELPA